MSMKSNMSHWNTIASSKVRAGSAVAGAEKPKPEVVSIPDEELSHRRHMRQVEDDLRISRSYSQKYDNAKSRNKSFSLTLDDWRGLMTQTTCLYSGKNFINDGVNSRTVERINPFLGYTPENTTAVTYAANKEKALLDSFMHGTVILDEMKLKLLRKAVYLLEKKIKIKNG